jgi:HEAT repeat protein
MQKSIANMRKLWLAVAMSLLVLPVNALNAFVGADRGQERTDALTPLQLKIEKQRQRLSSADIEERREALTQLGAMHYPSASRAAVAGLTDAAPIVRATAATAILALPAEEAVQNLIPLLSDKDEFVRQQAAYALGKTRSRSAVAPLITALGDKKDSVRGAAVVALGQIRDPTAVVSLAVLLDPQSASAPGKKAKKAKKEQNVFVLRAAAQSLGQIKDPAGVPALIAVLQNEKADSDVRREAAFALGEIRDASAIPALLSAETSLDPYLSQAAKEALGKIRVRRLAAVVEGAHGSVIY